MGLGLGAGERGEQFRGGVLAAEQGLVEFELHLGISCVTENPGEELEFGADVGGARGVEHRGVAGQHAAESAAGHPHLMHRVVGVLTHERVVGDQAVAVQGDVGDDEFERGGALRQSGFVDGRRRTDGTSQLRSTRRRSGAPGAQDLVGGLEQLGGAAGEEFELPLRPLLGMPARQQRLRGHQVLGEFGERLVVDAEQARHRARGGDDGDGGEPAAAGQREDRRHQGLGDVTVGGRLVEADLEFATCAGDVGGALEMPALIGAAGAASHGDPVAGEIEVLGVEVGGVERERLGFGRGHDSGERPQVRGHVAGVHVELEFHLDLLGCGHLILLTPTTRCS